MQASTPWKKLPIGVEESPPLLDSLENDVPISNTPNKFKAKAKNTKISEVTTAGDCS